jgi:ABC-type transport system involved in multi-copper enzyme maturation permease subunit
VGIGIAVSVVWGAHHRHDSAAVRASLDPTNMSLAGLAFGDLAIAVLGVLVMSGEYSSGTISSTLAAVPRRPMLMAAKAAVLGAVALVLGEVVTFVMFVAGQLAMGHAPHASLSQPTVLRAVALSGAFLALVALFGLGLGTLIRHGAGAVAAAIGFILALPFLVQSLPGHLLRFTPEGILSSSVGAVKVEPFQLEPWAGFALMGLYAVVALVAGTMVLTARDA